MRRKSYMGITFGRWTVTGDAPDQKRSRMLACVCECGNTKEIYLGSLTSGASSSCGCLNSEMASARRKTHGLAKTRTHNIWVPMKARCLNESCRAYKNYGGRGITVAERWLEFSNFLEDMGECPDSMSLERKENSEGYSKDNCKWATAKEQANNTRRNQTFSVDGQTLTISQISELYGVEYFMLRARLMILKWPVEKAIKTPSRQSKPTEITQAA